MIIKLWGGLVHFCDNSLEEWKNKVHQVKKGPINPPTILGTTYIIGNFATVYWYIDKTLKIDNSFEIANFLLYLPICDNLSMST